MFLYFLLAGGLSLLLTFLVRKISFYWGILDYPNSPRKIHTEPIALGGGVAPFLAFSITIFGIYLFTSHFRIEYIHLRELLFIFAGGLIIILGGLLDDKYNLPPRYQLISPILAIFIVIVGGINIDTLTNPFGGNISLDYWQLGVGGIFLLSNLFTFLWLLGLTYTTKLLDGLDGLTSGIGLIAAVFLAIVSVTKSLYQVDTAIFNVVLAGALFGFLCLNFHPAKIFLGEGGSLWVGFIIGISAIIAGGKLTTTLLVMGLPLLDVVFVIGRRFFIEKKSPFSTSDQKHLHHKLLATGLSHRQAVLFYYACSILLGSLILLVHGPQKIIALLLVLIIMLVISSALDKKYHKNYEQN